MKQESILNKGGGGWTKFKKKLLLLDSGVMAVKLGSWLDVLPDGS